jgi:hypothetical protein
MFHSKIHFQGCMPRELKQTQAKGDGYTINKECIFCFKIQLLFVNY